MNWKKPGILLLFLPWIVGAEALPRFSVRDIYKFPGLQYNQHKKMNFQWGVDSKSILYCYPKNEHDRYLLQYNLTEGTIDTLLTTTDMRWIEGSDTIRFYPDSVLQAPDGSFFVLKGGRDLFRYDRETGASVRLTEDGKPKNDVQISPDSRFISFVQDYNLFLIESGGGRIIQLTRSGTENLLNGVPDWVYKEEFSLKSAYRWSEDSKKIAFMQTDRSREFRFPIPDWTDVHPKIRWQYYPKAGDSNPRVQIGIIRIDNQQVNWVECQTIDMEYIPRFDWLPDSKRIALQTLNRGQNHLKLYFANIETASCDLILEEKDPYWLNIYDLYHFCRETEQFIWYSEKDGYAHLYLYDNNGKILQQLTAGRWNVTELNAVDEKGKFVYFTSNAPNLRERHIGSVCLTSGELAVIDKGPGTHRALFAPNFKYFIEFYSTIDTPAKVFLADIDGRRKATLYQNDGFDAEKFGFGHWQFLEVPSKNGGKLFASMLLPNDFDPQKKYPVLINVYGGPHAQESRDYFASPWHQMLSQLGYIVFILDNRGSYGRGRDWERDIYIQLGKLELEDQLAGVDYLKSLDYVDPGRIGIWGWSYGGYMTLMALAKAPAVFKIGIAIAPVTHWKYYDSIYTERYMGLPRNNPESYEESSPLNFADNIKADLFLAHGLADDNVHYQQSAVFVDKLIEYNKRFEYRSYPNRKHGISDDAARIDLFEKLTEFIHANL